MYAGNQLFHGNVPVDMILQKKELYILLIPDYLCSYYFMDKEIVMSRKQIQTFIFSVLTMCILFSFAVFADNAGTEFADISAEVADDANILDFEEGTCDKYSFVYLKGWFVDSKSDGNRTDIIVSVDGSNNFDKIDAANPYYTFLCYGKNYPYAAKEMIEGRQDYIKDVSDKYNIVEEYSFSNIKIDNMNLYGMKETYVNEFGNKNVKRFSETYYADTKDGLMRFEVSYVLPCGLVEERLFLSAFYRFIESII